MRRGERRTLSAETPSAAAAARTRPRVDLEHALAAVVIVVAVAALWMVPRQTGDLYIAYAGARDVLDGKLGAIDDWSYANPGRRWLNQNWGTHLLYYGAFRLGGPYGILALKLALLIALAITLVLVIRAHRVGRPTALLVAGSVMIAARPYVDLRPNLITLTLCPLLYWILLRTRRRPLLVWAAVGVLWVWSNMHAGFMFGLALLALWSALRLVGARDLAWQHERSQLVAATLVAVALAALGNPFGFENLTHPLVAGSSSAWREIVEWMPIFTPFDVDARYGSRVEFLVGITLATALVVARLLGRERRARDGETRLGAADVALALWAAATCTVVIAAAVPVRAMAGTRSVLAVFATIAIAAMYAAGRVIVAIAAGHRAAGAAGDGRGATVDDGDHVRAIFGVDAPTLLCALVASAVVVVMALGSRRFVPLALIVMAPLLALHVEWFLGAFGRRPLPLAAAALAVIVLTLRAMATDATHYRADNPRHPRALASVYDRMIYNDTYPHGAAEFMNRNGVSGRVYQDWRWEGFMRWRSPQLALDVGGRAQQAYDEASYRRHMAIWNGRDPLTRDAVDRVGALAALQVHYVLVSLHTDATALVGVLLGPGSSWTVLYFDRATNVLLGDVSAPDVATLLRRLIAGELWFPDAGTAALSRALAMSFRPDIASDDRRAALVAANAVLPKVASYHRLVEMAGSGDLGVEWLLAYLHDEYERLATAPADAYAALDTLRTRERVAELVVDVARRAPGVLSAAEIAAIGVRHAEMAAAIAAIERDWPP